MTKILETEQSWYHYTTFAGALGILQSQSLWATHYTFLNDQSEMKLFDERLMEHFYSHFLPKFEEGSKKSAENMEKINAMGGLHKATRDEVERYVEILSQPAPSAYIASFVGPHRDPYVNKNGLLSQWRGYGIDGGVAIEFDTHRLQETLQLEKERASYTVIERTDVIYSDDEERFQAELKEFLGTLTQFLEQQMSNINAGKGPVEGELAAQAFVAYLEGKTRYKHCGFKEENERRIVCFPAAHSDRHFEASTETKPEKKVKYREKNGVKVPVPYIELFDDLPITRIIVGPHRDKDYRAALLRTKVKPDVKVEVSDIPYV